jgi:ceramide glucosyltransferase
MLPVLTSLGFACLAAAAAYEVLAVLAMIVWRLTPQSTKAAVRRPVTIFKPLRGAEPGLYENLRSFCRQDYPEYQIVFGLCDAADPAHDVVQRLAAEFPTLSITTVVDSQVHGANGKISNLINMLPYARHDVFAVSDSDCRVCPEYLDRVTAPLADPRIGLVTCLYRGVPTPSVWSRLGAMYFNEWYAPSVLLAWLFGHEGYVSGQSVSMTRETLNAIGGFAALANHLADDHQMGKLVRGLGLRILLSRYTVEAEHHEPNLAAVALHELRWMRTLRTLAPWSINCIFVTFSVPLALLGVLMAGVLPGISLTAWCLFGTTVALRMALHFMPRWGTDRGMFADLWLLPLRDLLLCWVWWWSFFTSRVTWRGVEFAVGADGTMHRVN